MWCDRAGAKRYSDMLLARCRDGAGRCGCGVVCGVGGRCAAGLTGPCGRVVGHRSAPLGGAQHAGLLGTGGLRGVGRYRTETVSPAPGDGAALAVPKTKIRTRDKIGYATGQIADSAKFVAFDTFLFFYYNQVLGLSGTLAGLSVAIALVFDAITDPLVGSLSDGWRGTRYGRRHPFIIVSVIPLALSVFAIFQPPDGLAGANLFVWMTVFAILARGSMTLYGVPYISLGAEMTSDYHERTSIVAWRQMFGYVAAVVILGVAFGVFFAESPAYSNGMLNKEGYRSYAILSVSLIVVSGIVMILATKKFRNASPNANLTDPHPIRALVKAFRELKQALSIRSFSALFTGLLAIFILSGIQKAFTNHVGVFFWEFTTDELFIFAMSLMVGIMIGVPIAGILAPHFEKKNLFLSALALSIIVGSVSVVSRLLGIAPENDDPILIWYVSGWTALWALLVGITMVIGDSMMADITDDYEARYGDRQEGIFFGARSFSAKASAGIGTLLGGVGLDLIGFPENAAQAGDIPELTLDWVALLSGPIWAPLSFLALLFVMRYDITRARLQDIHQTLMARRDAKNQD